MLPIIAYFNIVIFGYTNDIYEYTYVIYEYTNVAMGS